jgi:apolipoprotein N-acyltransferase
VPHLIRRQVLELEARGETPDMLVCVTNDGWFWGSGVLDLHYKCSIFRAVEHRRSMLVAANTGFSTAVDPSGRVLAVGPRRDVATLHVDVPAYRMASFYSQYGDWFAGTCLLLTVAVAGIGIWTRRRAGHSEHSSAALE